MIRAGQPTDHRSQESLLDRTALRHRHALDVSPGGLLTLPSAGRARWLLHCCTHGSIQEDMQVRCGWACSRRLSAVVRSSIFCLLASPFLVLGRLLLLGLLRLFPLEMLAYFLRLVPYLFHGISPIRECGPVREQRRRCRRMASLTRAADSGLRRRLVQGRAVCVWHDPRMFECGGTTSGRRAWPADARATRIGLPLPEALPCAQAPLRPLPTSGMRILPARLPGWYQR